MNSNYSSLSEVFSEHLHYELDMLVATYQRLSQGISDPVCKNAFIESFCLHARSLIDFFSDRGGVCATEFTSSSYRPFQNGAIPPNLITKLNTQVAHLTHRRTSKAEEKIDGKSQMQLFAVLLAEAQNFGRHLKPEFLSYWRYAALSEAQPIAPLSGNVATLTVTAAAPSATNFVSITTTTTGNLTYNIFSNSGSKSGS